MNTKRVMHDLISKMTRQDAEQLWTMYRTEGRTWCMDFLEAQHGVEVRRMDDPEVFLDELIDRILAFLKSRN
jgi:hypothetical protein